MAYSPVNNNKFDSGDVIIGADIAQLNDNIEDTRLSVVNQYATVYEWSSPIQIAQSSATSTDEIEIVFANPTTTTYYGKDFDALNSNNRIDLSNTLPGDEIFIRIYYDDDYSSEYSSGLNTQIRHVLKSTFTDSTFKEGETTRNGIDSNTAGSDLEIAGNLNLGLDYANKNGEVILELKPGTLPGNATYTENLSIKKLEFLVNYQR